MDYFNVEKSKKYLKDEIIEQCIGNFLFVTLVSSLAVGLLMVANKEYGIDVERWMIIVVTIGIVVYILITRNGLKEYLNGETYTVRDKGLSRVKQLEKREKMNKVMGTFDKSENYKKYVESTGKDAEKFVEEMVYIKKRIPKLKGHVNDYLVESLNDLYISTVIEPNYYERSKKVFDRKLKLVKFVEEYERLKEESEKDKYRLGKEGIELREKVKLMGLDISRVKEEWNVPRLGVVTLEDIDYFIEKVNGL